MPVYKKRTLTKEQIDKNSSARQKANRGPGIFLNRGLTPRVLQKIAEDLSHRKELEIARQTGRPVEEFEHTIKSHDFTTGLKKSKRYPNLKRPTGVQLASRIAKPFLLRITRRHNLSLESQQIVESLLDYRPKKIPGTEIKLRVPSEVHIVKLINLIGVKRAQAVISDLVDKSRYLQNKATFEMRRSKKRSDIFLNVVQPIALPHGMAHGVYTSAEISTLIDEFVQQRFKDLQELEKSHVKNKETFKRQLQTQIREALVANSRFRESRIELA